MERKIVPSVFSMARLPLFVSLLVLFYDPFVESFSVSKDSRRTTTNQDGLDQDIVDGLDLAPLMHEISRHCATLRGRNVLHNLVEAQTSSPWRRLGSNRRRMDRYYELSNLDGTAPATRLLCHKVCQVASTLEEAQRYNEWTNCAKECIRSNQYPESMYPVSDPTEPFSVSTDDDQWLFLSRDELQLQHVWFAQHVTHRLLEAFDFIQQDPVFDSLFPTTGRRQLELLYETIRETVVVIDASQNTVLDAKLDAWNAPKAYSFALNASHFTVLDVLSNDAQREAQKAEIKTSLVDYLYRAREHVCGALDVVAALDILFAKAAFGLNCAKRSENRPEHHAVEISHQPTCIRGFVHPFLPEPTPIDLDIDINKPLIISGRNGGGKSMALKSFGLTNIMARMGIPVVGTGNVMFAENLFVCVGDYQNILSGESSFTSQLNRYAELIDNLQESSSSWLILLDELGSGTEESTGGAIGQAILEKIMASPSALQVVATTHSPHLKSLSYDSDLFDCVAVGDQFGLQYGCIGESQAFRAAVRSNLPHDVTDRIRDLASDQGKEAANYLKALSKSLEDQINAAKAHRNAAETSARQSAQVRKATMALASSYEEQFRKLEQRVETCHRQLECDTDLELVGATLSNLRTARKQVRREADRLRERGLKRVSTSYDFSIGESVVVIDEKSAWNGDSGTVVAVKQNDKVVVSFADSLWADLIPQHAVDAATNEGVFSSYTLAIWDYEGALDRSSDYDTKTNSQSRRKLTTLLSAIQSDSSKNDKQQSGRPSNFQSSRQRKASKKLSKKKRK